MVVRRNNFSGPREAASRVMALFVGRDVRCVSIELSEFLVARLAIPLLLLLLLLAGRISFLDFRKCCRDSRDNRGGRLTRSRSVMAAARVAGPAAC